MTPTPTITPDRLLDDRWPVGFVSEQDRQRYMRYGHALSFYEGGQWLGRRRSGEARLTFNYARALVRKVASYVFPAPVTFSVLAGGDQAIANRAEQLLGEAVAASDLARLDVELCTESAVLGDAAMKITWDAVAAKPTVAAVDPATLVAWSAPDNPRRVIRMAQRYGLPGEAAGAILGEAPSRGLDPHKRYVVVEDWTDDRWRLTIDGQLARDEANPYGWIPYVVATNNPRPHAFWGESDLLDLFDVCTELNSRMSVLAQILQLSGAPIAVLENVDGANEISVGPGAKWELPEGSRAYLLDLLGSHGISMHVDYVNLLYRALHDLSETPRTAFGDSGRTLSGAALEVEIQPLVQKVARKRRQWGAVYHERNTRLLDLLERFGGEDLAGLRRTAPIWPDVLPSDRESSVRNAVALVESGIQSRRTAIATLGGDDPDGELALVAEERAMGSSAATS
jgi:hypothetical protein